MITTSNNTFPLKPIRSKELENLKCLNIKLHEVYEKIKRSGLQINENDNSNIFFTKKKPSLLNSSQIENNNNNNNNNNNYTTT